MDKQITGFLRFSFSTYIDNDIKEQAVLRKIEAEIIKALEAINVDIDITDSDLY
jgi:hypothetical protein